MSAEKNFCGERCGFLFVFCGLWVVVLVFWALFELVLWCGSAWFVVRFNVGLREVCVCCAYVGVLLLVYRHTVLSFGGT